MSAGKFASMTASLLARKGDAQPSGMTEPGGPHRPFAWARVTPPPPTPVHRAFEKPDIEFSVPPTDMRTVEHGTHMRRDDPPPAAVPVVEEMPTEEKAVLPVDAKTVHEPAAIGKPRRLFVTLSPSEYQRLGIVAVKRDSTRHQLLRDAFLAFLERASQESGCACVSGESCRGTCKS